MRLLAALLLCVIALSGSVPRVRATAEALPHDAYIWQRAWTPPVIAAAHRSSDLVRAWRILVAEAAEPAAGPPFPCRGRRSWTARPVIGVIRIDGRLDEARMPALLDQIMSSVEASGASRPASKSTMTARPPSSRPTPASSPAEIAAGASHRSFDHRAADLDEFSGTRSAHRASRRARAAGPRRRRSASRPVRSRAGRALGAAISRDASAGPSGSRFPPTTCA